MLVIDPSSWCGFPARAEGNGRSGLGDQCLDVAWGLVVGDAHCAAESFDFLHQQLGSPVREVYGEEISGPRGPVTAVFRRAASVPSRMDGRSGIFGRVVPAVAATDEGSEMRFAFPLYPRFLTGRCIGASQAIVT